MLSLPVLCMTSTCEFEELLLLLFVLTLLLFPQIPTLILPELTLTVLLLPFKLIES